MCIHRLLLVLILAIATSIPVGTPLLAQNPEFGKRASDRFLFVGETPPSVQRRAIARPGPVGAATFSSPPTPQMLSPGEFRTEMIRPLPGQEPGKTYKYPAVLDLGNNVILIAYMEHGWDYATLWVTRSSDGGTNWSDPREVAKGEGLFYFFLRLTRTSSGRVLLADESPGADNHLFYSDDDGLTWIPADIDDIVQPRREDWPFIWSTDFRNLSWCGEPYGPVGLDAPSSNSEPILGPVGEDVWHVYSDLADGTIKYYVSQDGLSWTSEPRTMLTNPDSATSFLYVEDIVPTGGNSYLAAFKKLHTDVRGCSSSTVLSHSLDGGETWSTPEPLDKGGLPSDLGRLKEAPDGTLWYVFQDSLFNWGVGYQWLPPSDIYYMTSEDGGTSWSAPERFTNFIGTDIQPDFGFTDSGPLVAFNSTRFLPGEFTSYSAYGYPNHGQIWIGSPVDGGEYAEVMPPVVQFELPFRFTVSSHEEVEIRAVVADETGLQRVWVAYDDADADGGKQEVDLTRVGTAMRGELWSAAIGPLPLGGTVDFAVWAEDADGNRSYADRIPENFYYWFNDLMPARFYVLPRHDVGRVCADLTSAVSPRDLPWWFLGGFEPRSGGVGPWPINLPYRSGTASMRWPCPGGYNYLWDAEFFLGIRTFNDVADPRSINQWGAHWTEVERSVESAELSDQDYRLRYEDSEGLGARVTQRSYQYASGDSSDIVFFEYTIENTGSRGKFGDLVAALYFDPEIGIPTYSYGGDDYMQFNHWESVLYAYDGGDVCVQRGQECLNGHIAMVLLSEQEIILVNHRHWFDYVDGSLSTDLWDDGISPDLESGDPVGPGDATGALGVRVDSLGVGDSVAVGFALIMADSPEDLLDTKVPLAREIYKCLIASVCTGVESSDLPNQYALHANYPNPFNPATTIRFDLPVSTEVSLTVFDMLGREVARLAEGLHPAGSHVYRWDASGFADGVYVYRLTANEYVASRTLVLMK